MMIETRSDCVVTLVIGDRLVLYSKLPEYLLTSTIAYPLIKESPSEVSGVPTPKSKSGIISFLDVSPVILLLPFISYRFPSTSV